MRAFMILGLVLGASPAFAQDLGVYTGVSVGVFDHRNETGGAFSDTVPSWKLYGGCQLGEYFGLEIGREWPSTLEVADPGSPLTIATRRLSTAHSVDFTLTTFRAVGRLPLNRFDLWMAYGTFSMDADVEFDFVLSSTLQSRSLSVEDSDELFALGVDWKLGEIDRAFDLRLEYQWLGFPFSDASTLGIGVAYRFGGL